MNVLQQCCKPMVLPKIHSHMDKSNTGTQSLQTLSRRVITQNAICILSTKKKKMQQVVTEKKKKKNGKPFTPDKSRIKKTSIFCIYGLPSSEIYQTFQTHLKMAMKQICKCMLNPKEVLKMVTQAYHILYTVKFCLTKKKKNIYNPSGVQ